MGSKAIEAMFVTVKQGLPGFISTAQIKATELI